MAKLDSTDKLLILTKVLKTIRIEKGMLQDDVAKKLGLPQSFVSDYERSRRKLDLIRLDSVCEALETSLEDLVKRYSDEVATAANRIDSSV